MPPTVITMPQKAEDDPPHATGKKDKKSVRGTCITLHINDDASEFLEDYRIRSLVRKYADYLPVAIMMEKKKEENKTENKDDKKTETKDKEKTAEYEQVNSMTAIRQKNKKEVKEEEYNKHFQSLAF